MKNIWLLCFIVLLMPLPVFSQPLAVSSTDFRLIPQEAPSVKDSLVAASPDGKMLATASSGGVSLWDMTGRLLRKLDYRVSASTDFSLSGLGFNPDGRLLTVVVNGDLLVFEVATGAHTKFRDMSEPVFSPDGSFLAVRNNAYGALRVKILDGKTLAPVREFHPSTVDAAQTKAFTPDGRMLVVSGVANLYFYDTGTGEVIQKYTAPPWKAKGVSLDTQEQADRKYYGVIVNIVFHPKQDLVAMSNGDSETIIRNWRHMDQEGLVLPKRGNIFCGVAFSPSGDILATSAVGETTLWDLNWNRIGSVPATYAVFTPDGKYLFYAADGLYQLYDIRRNSVEVKFGGQRYDEMNGRLSPGASYLAAMGGQDGVFASTSTLMVWDLKRVKPAAAISRFTGRPVSSDYAFSPDERFMVWARSDEPPELYDTKNWSVVRRLSDPGYDDNAPEHVKEVCNLPNWYAPKGGFVPRVFVSPNNATIVAFSGLKRANVWRAGDGKLIGQIDSPKCWGMDGSADLSADGRNLVAITSDNKVRIWDISSGKLLSSFDSFMYNPHVYFSANADELILFNAPVLSSPPQPGRIKEMRHGMYSGILLNWRSKSKTNYSQWLEDRLNYERLYSLRFSSMPRMILTDKGLVNPRNNHSLRIIMSGDEWIMFTPDGYFDASRHGGESMNMVRGGDAYGVDQFAVRNNRPDIILERMGIGTPDQIRYYNLLYRKRLMKLGLSEAALDGASPAPEAKITGAIRNGKFASVTFQLTDSAASLKRYNIYADGVPLFGPYGREIAGGRFEGTESVELVPGKNKIEISAINRDGVESYRAMTYMDYFSQEKGDLYYLGFGVSKYKDAAISLSYANKDARDMEAAVKKMSNGFAAVHTKTLTDAEVTAENIKKAGDFLKDAKAGDTVILFIAGHGGYDKTADAKYYYLPYEADPARLASTGVDFDSIESLVADIKPRKKLVLMDTCDSGELEEEAALPAAVASARGLRSRALRKPGKARGTVGLRLRPYLYDKDRFIYNNIARRTGAVVFSSSRGGESSYESSLIMNGFFTSGIIAALGARDADRNGDNKIDSNELRDYVHDSVSKESGGLQHPTIDRDNLYQKIELPFLIDQGL